MNILRYFTTALLGLILLIILLYTFQWEAAIVFGARSYLTLFVLWLLNSVGVIVFIPVLVLFYNLFLNISKSPKATVNVIIIATGLFPIVAIYTSWSQPFKYTTFDIVKAISCTILALEVAFIMVIGSKQVLADK